jgi:hypothetical protein
MVATVGGEVMSFSEATPNYGPCCTFGISKMYWQKTVKMAVKTTVPGKTDKTSSLKCHWEQLPATK